jgi:hypothetical protein
MASFIAIRPLSGPSRPVAAARLGHRAPCRRYTRYARPRASSEGTESARGGPEATVEPPLPSTSELIIKPRPASRQAGRPPQPVQIEHTSSFLIRKSEQERREKYVNGLPEDPGQAGALDEDDLDFSENPVGWVLRRTDQSLDAMEGSIPDDAKEAITYVTGNLGTKASQVAMDAAKLAAKGGMKVAKVAVPAGTWVISKGFGALISVASNAAKAKQQKNQEK